MKTTASNSKNAGPKPLPLLLASLGVSLFILAALAGLLALSTCTTTERGLTREQALYRAGTNVVATLESRFSIVVYTSRQRESAAGKPCESPQ